MVQILKIRGQTIAWSEFWLQGCSQTFRFLQKSFLVFINLAIGKYSTGSKKRWVDGKLGKEVGHVVTSFCNQASCSQP